MTGAGRNRAKGRHGRHGIAWGLAVVLALGACGTRVERNASPAAAGEAGPSTPVDAGVAFGPETTPLAPEPSQASEVTPSGGYSASPAGEVGGSTAAAPSKATKPQAASTEATSATRPERAAPPEGATTNRESPPKPARGQQDRPAVDVPAKVGPKSPALLASIGIYSGPIGPAVIPVLEGAQTWVKFINAQGGLNGHEVRLIVYDDGGDPARHRAQAQDAIEARGVIGFLTMNTAGITGQSVDYITSKGVPVIGSETVTAGFYTSPMYFPQETSLFPATRALVHGIADQLRPRGISKLGVVYCAESPRCEGTWNDTKKSLDEVGFKTVFQAKVSVAQPDYTAVCLGAANSGAEFLVMYITQDAISRLATSCTRQSYKPIYAIYPAVFVNRFGQDPNFEGAVAVSYQFPHYMSSTPLTAQFQRAAEAFLKKTPENAHAQGWVAGKLLEKAGANLPEPPTREALLRGLWTIKNDDLGGLTQPLTFVENEPAKPMSCWWNQVLKGGAWTSPDGFKRKCLDD